MGWVQTGQSTSHHEGPLPATGRTTVALLFTIAADTTAVASLSVPVTPGGARLRPTPRMTAVG